MEERFFLTYGATKTQVEQPRDWIDFQSEIQRDFDVHGAIYQFTAGDLKLGFPGDGRTILENAFQNDGYDAVVVFQAEERDDEFSDWTDIFTGNVVFSEREKNQDYFECSVEVSNFIRTVTSRLKTKVKLDSTEDLDGNTLNGTLTEQSGAWNTIRLNQKWDATWLVGALSSQKETYTDDPAQAMAPVNRYMNMGWINIGNDKLKSDRGVIPGTWDSSPPTEPNFIFDISGTL